MQKTIKKFKLNHASDIRLYSNFKGIANDNPNKSDFQELFEYISR